MSDKVKIRQGHIPQSNVPRCPLILVDARACAAWHQLRQPPGFLRLLAIDWSDLQFLRRHQPGGRPCCGSFISCSSCTSGQPTLTSHPCLYSLHQQSSSRQSERAEDRHFTSTGTLVVPILRHRPSRRQQIMQARLRALRATSPVGNEPRQRHSVASLPGLQ